MAATDTLRGVRLCNGRYRLESVLGTGGMAVVCRAVDERLERPVAVKLLADHLSRREDFVRRFRREARVAARLSHPNLVAVYDFGTERGRPFLVMELVDGPNLSTVLRSGDSARLDPLRLARGLLSALAHIHAAGIVHRDIKPANILLGSGGTARLTDFGVARPSDATQLTEVGLVIGTARYMPPEVLRGEPATARSDLYALGRVLEEVLAASPVALPSLRALCPRLTAEDPAQRLPSAERALVALEQEPERTAPTARRATGIPARRPARVRPRPALPSPSGARAWRERLDARTAVALGAVAVVLALVLTLAALGRSHPTPPVAAPAASAPLARQLDALSQSIAADAR